MENGKLTDKAPHRSKTITLASDHHDLLFARPKDIECVEFSFKPKLGTMRLYLRSLSSLELSILLSADDNECPNQSNTNPATRLSQPV